QAELKEKPLETKDRKELADVTRALADLGIVSRATRAAAINEKAQELKAAQERLQQVQDRDAQLKRSLQAEGEEPNKPASDKGKAVKAERDALAKQRDTLSADLARSAERLAALSQPDRLADDGLMDGEGNLVSLPPRGQGALGLGASAREGRRLLIQRGCL